MKRVMMYVPYWYFSFLLLPPINCNAQYLTIKLWHRLLIFNSEANVIIIHIEIAL